MVVDEDVDVQNVREVAWKALNNIDPERDIQFVLGPVDSLDHSSRMPNYGSKMGVDATKKWQEEGFTRPWPDVIRMPEDVKQRVARFGRRPDFPDAGWNQDRLSGEPVSGHQPHVHPARDP